MKVWEFDAFTCSETLRAHREAQGLTQTELAKKAGCNLMSIANYENGYRLPRVDILLKIAKALGFDEIRFSTKRQWNP